MKKRWLASIVLAVMMAFGAFSQVEASARVIWDGAEIVAGQTGKLSFNKDTKIYKKNANGSFTSMVAPKGSFYRVYGTEKSSTGTIHHMSGGYRVQATNLVTYRDIPKAVQDQTKLKVTTKTYYNQKSDDGIADITYAEVSGLSSESLQRQMNNYLMQQAAAAKKEYDQFIVEKKEFPYDFTVWRKHLSKLGYNSKGYVSFIFENEEYRGGAHGNNNVLAANFNLITGKHINLNEFINNSSKRQKFDQYVFQQMKKAKTYWEDEFSGVPMTQPYYIKDDGIMLIYNPYDLGNYVTGVRYIYVPFTVFQ